MTKEEMIQNGLSALFDEQTSKAIAFIAFAKEHNFTGRVDPLKDPLYNKTHQQGELAGQVEAVSGVRFETETNGVKGFVLMALSRNAAKSSLNELMKNATQLQVRVEQFNGYQNLTLCTGQSDREIAEGGCTFAI